MEVISNPHPKGTYGTRAQDLTIAMKMTVDDEQTRHRIIETRGPSLTVKGGVDGRLVYVCETVRGPTLTVKGGVDGPKSHRRGRAVYKSVTIKATLRLSLSWLRQKEKSTRKQMFSKKTNPVIKRKR